jgi:dolichyl-phosphate-mannose-protein mannosyltransferase
VARPLAGAGMNGARRFALSGFPVALAGLALIGFAARVAYALSTRDPDGFTGDALWYHLVANNLADGHGYVVPFQFVGSFDVRFGIGANPVPTAFHLPLFPTVLAGFSVVGLDGEEAHLIVGCACGALTIVLVGLVGRRLAGPVAGVAAAALAALYPAMVMNDSVGLSESLTGPTMAAALLAALRLRERPGTGRALVLGLLIGLATLNRSEALLLLPLLGVPALLPSRSLMLGGLAVLATAVTIAPWTIRNLTTFDRTTFLTTGDGSVFRGANCPGTYRGGFTGGWDIRCLAGYRTPRDESVLSERLRRDAFDYAKDNAGRVPVVVAARVARTFALYPSPSRQVNDLHFLEGRPRWLVWVAFAAYAAVAALAIAGIVGLRAQPGAVAIMLAPIALAIVTSALGYGTWRFRQAAEVALVTLAGVALAQLAGRMRRA